MRLIGRRTEASDALQDEVGNAAVHSSGVWRACVQHVAWTLLTACAGLDVLAAQGQRATPPDGQRVRGRAVGG